MRQIGAFQLLPGLLLVAISLGTVQQVAGQEGSSEEDELRVELGAMLGRGLPDSYFAPECSDGSGVGAFVSVVRAVHRWVDLSVDVQYLRDIGVGNCAAARVPPPAPYTSEEITSEGPSTWAPMISVSVGPELRSSSLMVRAVARLGIRNGLEREALLVLGGEARVGRPGGVQLIFGFDRWFTDVKVRRTLLQEQDGEIVLRDTQVEDASGDFGAVRLGVSFPVE